MEWRFWGILFLSGPFHVSSSLQHRLYSFVPEPRTWLAARLYCRDKHTDLAAVNDEEDLEKLPALVKSGVSYAFLGLYRSWGWSLSDADDHKAGEQTFWKWTRAEPQDQPHYCGSIAASGDWFATDCSSSLNFSCYDESITTSSERFSWVNRSMDWLSAQAHCRNQHTDLARVRNRLENEELRRMATEDPVWIGLTGASWAWSDGSQPSFVPWVPGQPSPTGPGDCAVLKVNGKPLGITAGDCAEKLPFFCYDDAVMKRTVALKLIADSSVNMTDPAVLESILKSMQKKLSDNGATVDVKLSWSKHPQKAETIEEEEAEASEEECDP
ncbi:macrophage mannose receptor 1-like [Clinocottus analis]|uniref:macrophage mannose receptor 1-like n=1 Tax=Clinocottus analis TaxID=304258 RepID=UPI0035BFDB71